MDRTQFIIGAVETGWDSYWRSDANRGYWEKPDDSVVQVVQELDRSRIKEVLDLGCGIGRHTILFAQSGFNVTALDSSAEALAALTHQLHEKTLHAKLVQCDYLRATFPTASFDFVLAYNVIYHGYLQDAKEIVGSVQRWLRQGGKFYFTCPSRRDDKYGNGEMVFPNTYKPLNSVHPGDVHYFADESDIGSWLQGFTVVAKSLDEHYWDNNGTRQLSSYWHVMATK